MVASCFLISRSANYKSLACAEEMQVTRQEIFSLWRGISGIILCLPAHVVYCLTRWQDAKPNRFQWYPEPSFHRHWG
jgi:hypothetical protein